MDKKLELPLSATINGTEWRLYSIEFDTCDGLFSSFLYAVSDEHAGVILEDLKSTGRVAYALVGVQR